MEVVCHQNISNSMRFTEHDSDRCGEDFVMVYFCSSILIIKNESLGNQLLEKFSECSRKDIKSIIKKRITATCVTEGTTNLGNIRVEVKRKGNRRLKRVVTKSRILELKSTS